LFPPSKLAEGLAHSIEAPGQPLELKSIDEGAQARTYIIERRDLTIDGTGDWRQAAISLETRASLKRQPRGVQLEYRVKAVNKAGQSSPSNTIAVVL